MMRQVLFLAAGAGGLSALLFLSGVSGNPAFILLSVLAQLPLFMAGLAAGALSAGLAGVITCALVALAAGPIAAVFVLLFVAIPPYVLVNRALLNRPDPETGDLEYYPPGLLLVWLAVLGAGLPILGLLLGGLVGGGIEASLTGLAAEALARPDLSAQFEELRRQLSQVTNGPVEDEDLIRLVAFVAPVVTTVFWVVLTAASGLIALALTSRSGRSLRPSFEPYQAYLPKLTLAALGAGLIMTLLPAPFGLFANLALAAFIPVYFFLGLAVLHDMSAPWSGRGIFLAGIYLAIPLLPGLTFGVALLGLIEQLSGFRERFKRS